MSQHSADKVKSQTCKNSRTFFFFLQDNHVLYTENVTFYMPFASKYDIYVMTQNLFQTRDFKYLTESHLENSCLTVNRIDGWDHANVTGYNVRSLSIRFIPTDIPKLFRFYLPYPNGTLFCYGGII